MPLGTLCLVLAAFPPGREATAPRDEIRPSFGYDSKANAFVITCGDTVAHQGWIQKSFPVEGGKLYRFEARRSTENVKVPRRSAIARVVW